MTATNFFQPAATAAPAAAKLAANPATPAGLSPSGSSPSGSSASDTVEQALARAQVAAKAKRLNEANGICADVLATLPEHPLALALQGIVAAMAGNPERGINLLSRAITLQPGNATWYAHLSSLCRMTHRIEEAVAMAQEAVRLDPNTPEHLVNLSLILMDADDPGQAMLCLLRALGLKHDHADGHLALAQILLAQGDFVSGWMEYEWRNLTEAGKATMPALTSAPWNGMRIPTGRLLLIGDQGYGDTIQFARYIPLAAERCQEVVLGCSAEIGPLLIDIPGVTQYCHRWDNLPDHTVHCRLSSLPYLLQTRADSIPARIPYLKADPLRVAHWRSRLQAMLTPDQSRPSQSRPSQSHIGQRRIGLAWTGRHSHPNDHRRSMPLAVLSPIVAAGGAVFVSLQKPVPARDTASMSVFPGMTDLSGDLADFGETAALIENLDLVITVDTAIAHLAGALGKPVWILIPKAADWRWQFDRDDSPWYPTVRLFRQRKAGVWDEPLDKLTAALRLGAGRQVASMAESHALTSNEI